MEPRIIVLKILPEHADNVSVLEEQLIKKLKVANLKTLSYRIIRKSLDARRNPIHYLFRIEVFPKTRMISDTSVYHFRKTDKDKRAIVIGFGPAGIFAALELLTFGIKPIVLERGQKVRQRRRDLMEIYRNKRVHPDSNYCFGEGGAGTFSDGKLYTRSKKRGDIQRVLRAFVEHGAPSEILYESHPHIGTNKLPAVVESLRQTIENAGGEVRFGHRVTDIDSSDNRVQGVSTNQGYLRADNVILATGHSAHDIFELLQRKSIYIESKPFALGVRIEHYQDVIDRSQYRNHQRSVYLPPSSYSLVHQVEGRGVFSFCMCPGGIIAPSMTHSDEIVVNGWSPSKRNGKFANSGLVVQVLPEDWKVYEGKRALAALHFQRNIERKAFVMAGSNLSAPAQRASDFLNRSTSKSLPECSYIPGVTPSDLHEVLPAAIGDRMSLALEYFNRKIPKYASHDALMVGVETRTSSPVRIPRHKDSLEHTHVMGLYPCGEGAGYAGGIMSSALDGIACARALGEKLANQIR